MIKLIISSDGTQTDITELCTNITWSGDYQQCVRTLAFDLVQSPTDNNIPKVECALGNLVLFSQDGQLLFMGYVFQREKSTNDSKISVRCYDRGIYLKKNQGSYKFNGQTAESIAQRICEDFEIPVGELATTGVAITRIFNGNSLYDIIQTAYTLASQKTGEKYIARFVGEKFCVLKKAVNDETLVLEGGVNLMSAQVSESLENIVNQIAIYDENDNLIRTVKRDDSIRLYGLLQEQLKQSTGKDVNAQASELLEECSTPEQKISVENLGNIAEVTGNSVVVHETYTGVYGLFFIDSDVHTWKNGQYYSRLVLNFQNIMDEKEVGSLPNRTGSKTVGKQTQTKEPQRAIEYVPGGAP